MKVHFYESPTWALKVTTQLEDERYLPDGTKIIGPVEFSDEQWREIQLYPYKNDRQMTTFLRQFTSELQWEFSIRHRQP
jgi:hypothetical protein